MQFLSIGWEFFWNSSHERNPTQYVPIVSHITPARPSQTDNQNSTRNHFPYNTMQPRCLHSGRKINSLGHRVAGRSNRKQRVEDLSGTRIYALVLLVVQQSFHQLSSLAALWTANHSHFQDSSKIQIAMVRFLAIWKVEFPEIFWHKCGLQWLWQAWAVRIYRIDLATWRIDWRMVFGEIGGRRIERLAELNSKAETLSLGSAWQGRSIRH